MSKLVDAQIQYDCNFLFKKKMTVIETKMDIVFNFATRANVYE